VSESELRVLYLLRDHPWSTASQVTGLVNLPLRSVHRYLSNLLRAGLVQAVHVPQVRGRLYALSADGIALLAGSKRKAKTYARAFHIDCLGLAETLLRAHSLTWARGFLTMLVVPGAKGLQWAVSPWEARSGRTVLRLDACGCVLWMGRYVPFAVLADPGGLAVEGYARVFMNFAVDEKSRLSQGCPTGTGDADHLHPAGSSVVGPVAGCDRATGEHTSRYVRGRLRRTGEKPGRMVARRDGGAGATVEWLSRQQGDHPTPVVTPIPLAEPPFIPGLEDAVPQPFHIILREGNKVWIVDSDGSDTRLLIDTEDRAGLYLGHYPVQGIEGPPLRWGSVSPDGTKLALVVTDLWEVEYKGQPFGWQIYLFDIQTGEFRFLVEGREPVWSPDGTRIAYVWGGALWVADVESGEGKELFSFEEGDWIIDITWSPSGHQITFLYQEGGMGGLLEMLMVNADGNEEAIQLLPSTGNLIGSPIWSPSGKVLYIIGERDAATARWFHNLWTMDADRSKQTQLTKETAVMSFAPSPDGDWVVFSGGFPYEETSLSYNLWLFDTDGSCLLRLTQGTFSDYDPQWSPDGRQVLFRREDKGILVLNLADGSLMQVYQGSADFSVTR